MVQELLRSWQDRILEWLRSDDEPDYIEIVGTRHEDGTWSCNFCTKNGIQKKYPDLYRHVWGHYPRGKTEDSPKKQSKDSVDSRKSVSIGDYVDDYDLEQPETDDEDLELQEPTGGVDSRLSRLRIYHREITTMIEENGRAIIHGSTHIGSCRGGHIKQNFKSAVRRIPGESLDNYEIENDGSGEYPIVIQRKD